MGRLKLVLVGGLALALTNAAMADQISFRGIQLCQTVEQIGAALPSGMRLRPTAKVSTLAIEANGKSCGGLTFKDNLTVHTFVFSGCYFELPDDVSAAGFSAQLEAAYDISFLTSVDPLQNYDGIAYLIQNPEFQIFVGKPKRAGSNVTAFVRSECLQGKF